MLLFAGEFARRGLGSCAVSPDRFSTTHNGLVESFELKGNQTILSAKVDDSILSCDSDGVLDGGVNDSLNLDSHGKALSFLLLDLQLTLPTELVPLLRGPAD